MGDGSLGLFEALRNFGFLCARPSRVTWSCRQTGFDLVVFLSKTSGQGNPSVYSGRKGFRSTIGVYLPGIPPVIVSLEGRAQTAAMFRRLE